ncbi:unnamed protein product [Cylindrotheca closterium]|uniref:DUF6824 domain-containing protein n=1 Tax=Cylindrotheca closterium TaxID=2856 RepID=A0AAD2GCJ8_9STRA|nr:unnamed protein product [Cylindrotheca closterium]
MTMNAEYIEQSPGCMRLCNQAGNIPVFTTNVKKEDVDTLLTEGMTRLTFEELQQEQEDLHGVSATISEEKVEVKVLLDRLDEHLNRMKMGTAFACAQSLNRDFCQNYDFRMMFLRANRYDPKVAAKQIIRFLDIKLELFGLEKLTEEITLKDLTVEDKEDLLAGSFQLLPFTDRAGRSIVLEIAGLRSGKSLLSELRARFYLGMNAIKSLEIPSRGIVFISYTAGKYRDKLNGAGFVENAKVALSLPYHIAGFHYCVDEAISVAIAKAGITITPDKFRSKIKIHHGSPVECQYNLSTYGIPPEALQFAVNDNEDMLDNHLSWYEDCLRQESTVEASSLRDPNKHEPNTNDVVFIGKKTKGNGNERLRRLALRHSSPYSLGGPKEKRELVDSMIAEIKRGGGRFLKQDSTGLWWEDVPISEVREKITQMFRNLRRPSGSQQRAAANTETGGGRITVGEPTENDVLFGRQFNQAGNLRLRELVEGMALEYDASNRGKKKKLAESIVKEIKGTGGRFLKPIKDGGQWEEVSDVAAGIKIATHFRNYRRCQKPKDTI